MICITCSKALAPYSTDQGTWDERVLPCDFLSLRLYQHLVRSLDVTIEHPGTLNNTAFMASSSTATTKTRSRHVLSQLKLVVPGALSTYYFGAVLHGVEQVRSMAFSDGGRDDWSRFVCRMFLLQY